MNLCGAVPLLCAVPGAATRALCCPSPRRARVRQRDGREAPPIGRRFGRPEPGPPASRRRPMRGTRRRRDGAMGMNYAPGSFFLVDAGRGRGPRPAHAGGAIDRLPASASSTSGHITKRTKVGGGNRGGRRRQRDEEKRPREEDAVPRTVNGRAPWGRGPIQIVTKNSGKNRRD